MENMPYGATARHIRGRVFKKNDGYGKTWALEVVNTKTGRVLATDDCQIYEKIADLSIEAVGAHRAAWFWGISKKDVK